MSLTAGGIRELHWHQEAEWSYMLLGRARITSVDQEGRNFIADVGPGDLWYFPQESHIRFKGWNIANFCSSSMMETFPILTPYPSQIGLHTLQKMFCRPISAFQRVPLNPFLQIRSISIRKGTRFTGKSGSPITLRRSSFNL